VSDTRSLRHPVYIDAPPYSVRSGGVRALHLLCHHLNRLGYEAFIIENSPQNAAAGLRNPSLNESITTRHRNEKRVPIVVYPEVTPGNPRGAEIVARYLLNKPGYFVPGITATFGHQDYFLHYAEEHALPGRKSYDMFMPLVDRSTYHVAPEGALRQGFVLYKYRAKISVESLPPWLTPLTVISMENPRSHEELAALYRHSRAMVTFERGTALLEALHTGCPVICIEGERLSRGAYRSLFGGAGLIWGWHLEMLQAAATETARFRTAYEALEQSTADRVAFAFKAIADDYSGRCSEPKTLRQMVSKLLGRRI
jgi:O-antigen biosynthesis protein